MKIKSYFVIINSTTIDLQNIIIVFLNFIIKFVDAKIKAKVIVIVEIMNWGLINFIITKELIIMIKIIEVLICALRFEFNVKTVALVNYFLILIEQQIQMVKN